MLLLHISDIHFKHPLCDSNMDPDQPFRTLLVSDVRARCQGAGRKVDAILVTGDIANAGKEKEYKAAYKWLSELAEACSCEMESVFVVPGNHDVDRKINAERAAVQNVHKAILSDKSPKALEKQFLRQFNDADAGHALFASLEEYNIFAARFGCNVYPTEKLCWMQDIELEHDVTLRLFGLTSTLLSGVDGEKDQPRQNLYMSPFQTVLNPEDNVVNVVLSHHPPDWLIDADDVDDAIRARATLHFFGHKHRQRNFCDTNYVRFSAGAVNPDRHEPGWEPGYNLINIDVAKESLRCYIDVRAEIMIWQTDPNGFKPKRFGDTEFLKHRVPVRARQIAPVAVSHSSVEKELVAVEELAPETVKVEATMSDEHSRNIVLRFWNLRASERREVATKLGIIESDEIALPEAERYDRALRRASERGLLEELAAEVKIREDAR